MCQRLWSAVVTGALLSAPTAAAQSDAGASLTRGGGGAALVLGEIVAVEKSPDGFKTVKVQVLRVYVGRAKLKGTTFEQRVIEQGSPGVGAFIGEPKPERGETGLWLMLVDENHPDPIWVTLSRAKHDPEARRSVEWAETIERLAGLKPPERYKAARDLCGHDNPRVVELAVEVLDAAPENRAFLKSLPDNRVVSRVALVRLDQLTIVRDGRDWLTSDGRSSLLARLTADPLTEEEGRAVVDHLRLSGFRNRVNLREVVEPLVALATNTKHSAAVREAAIDALVRVAVDRTAHGNPQVFDPLTGLVREGRPDAVRLRAATGLAGLSVPRDPPQFPDGSYTPAQVTVLRKLLADERDQDVAKALRKAIDNSK